MIVLFAIWTAVLIALHFVTVSALSEFVMATPTSSSTRHTLYDIPVSNNGARCRIILYKKGIGNDEVAIASPVTIGGLKSPAFTDINPEQKIPALLRHDDAENEYPLRLGESDTIARYLCTTYNHQGPSFHPDHPLSNLLARIHDVYLAPIQGCMYKAFPPFGGYGTRWEALDEYRRQWTIIESLLLPSSSLSSSSETSSAATSPMSSSTLYLCGDEVMLADATLFPSAVFARYMLPKFDSSSSSSSASSSSSSTVLPPVIEKWLQRMLAKDAVFQKVHEEIMSGLTMWERQQRWDTILGAGRRDLDAPPATIFDRILAQEIPASVVWEDDWILAFRDIHPVGPAHILLIPKKRNGLTRLQSATAEHTEILGRLLVAAAHISKDTTLGFDDGARIVINDGNDGGQEIPHLHVHVLGGRQFTWPPG